MAEPSKADLDRLLAGRVPNYRMLQVTADTAASLYGDKPLPPELAHKLAPLEAARAELLALPPAELNALIAASRARELAAQDAARFFNQPEALADFGFWCQVDRWTVDEAAALLLGRDPHAVTPATLQAELTPSPGLLKLSRPPQRTTFHQAFERLRTLLARAEGLDPERLTPAALVAWARRTQDLELPAALVQLMPATTSAPEPPATAAQPGTTETVPTPTSSAHKIWDEAAKAKLAQYREAHGTKAAAAHFGISEARVRKLLPGAPDKAPTSALPGPTWIHRAK